MGIGRISPVVGEVGGERPIELELGGEGVCLEERLSKGLRERLLVSRLPLAPGGVGEWSSDRRR